jgi:hypothetical protein
VRRLLEVALFIGLSSCGPDAPLTGAVPRPTSSRSDALRPDTPNTTEPPPNFAPGDVVERFSSPDSGVLVHFTRMGANRVPPLDSDDSGVPDFVEKVEATYRDVFAAYHGPWGFRRPPDDGQVPIDNGGDSRFDVYLVDFALRADGAFRHECLPVDPVHCPGYMVQENDFAGYAYPSPADGIVTVSSHEYFHGVQAGYSSLQGVNVTEGTAVWATERYAPYLNDLEGFSAGYLAAPDRSVDQEPTTAVDPYAYGLGLFFECLTALRGPDAVRDLWERIDGGAGWLGTLEQTLAEDGGSIATVLERCADYNLFTGARARAGYGHARADRLPLAATTESNGALSIPRVRMFRASSRYYHAFALPEGAFVWWKAAADAPDGGPASIRVRFALDAFGPPQLQALPQDVVTPLGGTAAFLLVSNVATGGSSVPVGLCVGSQQFVESCQTPDAGLDAGAPDAGPPDAGDMMMPPPKACGCGEGSGPVLVVLAALVFLRSLSPIGARVRRAGVGAVAVTLMLTICGAASAQELDAGEPEPDAGEALRQRAFEDAGLAAAPLIPSVSPPAERELTTVVTGGRLPQQLKDSTVAVEVVSRRQLQESGARDLGEALEARPGLETVRNVGTTGLRMGGLGPEYNLIMVDGQRISGRINGGIDLSRLSVENIEQIEIVKGPSSVLWGSDALAGTVNIITRKPTKPLGGTATIS